MKRKELKLNIDQVLIVAKQSVGKDVIETINARDEWRWVESKQEFSHWIKARIEEGGFVEGVDYTIDKKLKVKNQQHTTTVGDPIEYHISLDMAKHIGMMERNAKGKEVRAYFIERDKKLSQQRVIIQKDPFVLEELGLGLLQVGLEQRLAQKQTRRYFVNVLRNSIGCGNTWVKRLTNEIYQTLLNHQQATARTFREHMNLPAISSQYLTRDQLEGHIQAFVSNIEYNAIGLFAYNREVTFGELRSFVLDQAKMYRKQLIRIIQRRPVELVSEHQYNVVPMLPYQQRRMARSL